MKEFLKKTAFSLVVIASALLWTTCDVGLGEAVDNDAPSLTVTGPAKASVWADKVTITGTCSDDKGVKSVNILLKNTSTGASYPYSGIIDTSKKSASGAFNWERTVNELDPVTGKYPLPDGSYVADVTVTDINKRTSGVSSTAFDIDNTAPFFCVTSPSSLKIDGSKVYGRSVTISGEIADDHDIDHMSISVFRTDASGSNPQEITLEKKEFTGFETAGGTTVYIAKYFDTPPDASSDDYPLYQNYLKMYEGAQLGSDVYLYIVPTLEDTAGNVSDHCYVASVLRKLIAQTCGVAETIDSLQTAQLQRIYNGTYTLGELDAAKQAKALEILKGNPPAGSTITAADYYCQYDESDPSKQNCFGATVNSDNNPTYDFNGYENPTSNWVGVNTGGTVTITLKAGRDGWGILPKTLVVNLYDSSSSGNKGALAFSSATGAVLVRDATNKETKDIGTSVTSQSYYVTLPSLNAGKFYLLEAEGKDENDCDLSAFNGNKYGFKVAVTITPPTLTAPNDMFYVNGAGVKSSGDYKFRIDIKDESVEIQQNGVKVTGVIYADHVASKGYRDNYTPVKTVTKTYTSQIVKNPDNSFYLDVPIEDFAFGIDGEKNYTIALIASGAYKDGDGNKQWSNDKVFMFWADNKKPEVNLASPKATETLISEDFSSYEKDDETLKTYITPTGTWSDIGGSGTRKLWYTSDDTGTPSISWTAAAGYYVPGTDYYEKQATGCYGLVDTDKFEPGTTSVSGLYTLSLNGTAGKTWTPVDGASQNASSTPWEQKIEIEEGINKIFRVVGVDSVGNLSAVVGKTDLKYDFEAPKVELTSEPASNGYYNAANATGGKLTVEFTATDSYKIDAAGVSVEATKNGADAASGTSGYTCEIKQAKDASGNDDPKAVKVTITLTVDGTGISDGEWKWTVSANDETGRAAPSYGLIRIVDTVAPTFEVFPDTEPSAIKGKKIVVGNGEKSTWTYWDGAWYSSTGLVFNGNLTDSSSGVDKISYALTPVGATESIQGQKTLEAAPGTTPFTLTVTGFEQSVRNGAILTANMIAIKAVDKAGNESSDEILAINIDQSQPAFAAAWYTYAPTPAPADLAKAEGIIMSDGQKAMTVYGTVSCPLSGVAGLAWQIAGTEVTPTSVEWTTDTGLESESSYIGAAWTALPGESYAVTGWKAVIPAASLTTPGDANLSISNKAQKTTKDRAFVVDSDVTAPSIVLNTPDTKIAKYDAINAGTHDTTIPTTKPDGSPVPTEAKSVNGTLKISGSVSDDKELDEIGIYLSNDNTAAILPADTDITSENTGSKYNWTIPACKFSEYDAANKVYKFADGTPFEGNPKPVYIKIKAVDKAKNQTIAVFDYSVNPDSDRPIITITAPDDISAMTATNYVWKKNDSRIRGKVEDDDGFTNLKLEYSDDNGANWTQLNLTSGVFDFFGDGNDYDGKHDILFKVTDAEGTEFVSGDGTGDNKTWLRPKIKKDATDFYGKTDSDDTTVYIQIDTKKPLILSKSFKVIENGQEKFDAALGIVGGTRNKFWLFFYATDQSGINDDKVNFVFNGTEYSKAAGNLAIASKAYPDDESKIKNSGGADVYDNNPALNGARLVTVGPIDVNESESSQWDSGSYDGKITVYDNADMFREESFAVEVDNEKPQISRIAPSSSQTVSGNVNPYGTVRGAEKLWFKLSGSDASHDDYTASDVISQKSSLMWYLYFDGGVTTEEETHAKTLRRFIVDDLHVTTDEAIDDGSFTDIVSVYLWIKAQDAVGNFIEDKYLIKFDPQGSRPEVSFSYPLDDSETMGEDIKIYGGAKAKDINHPTIQDVFAQIAVRDSSAGDITSFPTAADWNFLSGKGYAVVKMSDGSAWPGSGTPDPTEYAIRSTVNGSSWSIKLNENGKINPPTGKTYNAAIRVKAYDGANYSEEEVKKFKIDGDNPSLKLLYLEQFGADGSSATATAQRDYKEGVYVTGKWFLTFELTDGQGMGLVKIGKAATPLDAAKPANIVTYFENGEPNLGQTVVTGTPDSEGIYKTVSVKLPLETDTGCGSQAVYVYFEDKGGKGGAQVARSYIVSFDNEKPRLAAQDDSDYSISTTVQQSDGWYSFGSKVSEENASDGTKQSGFERLAFYFTRGSGASMEIFDPMISKGAAGNRRSTTGLTFEDGLYWKAATVTRSDANLNMLTLSAKDGNVHTGGLAKLGGSIYRIKNVSDDGLSVEIEGQPESSYTDALFAIANVVDNEINEGASGVRRTTAGYGYGYNDPTNDDGDLMIETLTQNGTSWLWNASIYSKNIADGKVNIHYVAYDKAGNYSCAGDAAEPGYTPPALVDATVCNNRPRIARINLGTDLNGDNSVDFGDASIEKAKPYPESGELLTWNQDYNYGGAETKAVLGSVSNAHLTAKGMTVIKPELLGGNGNIYYAYKISKKDGTAITSGANTTTPLVDATSDPLVETVEEDKTKSDTTARGGEIAIQVGDFSSLGIVDTATNAPHKVEFTFYDQTEGAPAYGATGFDDRSDTATATIFMAVSIKDAEEPKATREDLFWRGAGAADGEGNPNNSVAWDGMTPLGHIDLSADLPDTFTETGAAYTKDGTTYPAAEMDRDSKASGKIVLRGTVSDNKMLYRIYVNILKGTTGVMDAEFAGAGMTKAAATEPGNGKGYIAAQYDAATRTWSNVDKLADNGVKFTVTNNKVKANGHSADWEFVWDTSYITNSADTDIKLDVYASDQVLASAASESGTLVGLNGTTKYALPAATETNVSGSTTATAGNKPATLRLDIVPYITGLKTMLSEKGAEFARTAKGHWPIWMRTDSPKAAGNYNKNDTYRSYETFTVNGFNLGAESLSQTKKQQSGYLVAQTGAEGSEIPSLNNINGNGSVYNQQPYDNNINLTDDVYLDVWQVNGKAADSQDLKAEIVTMKINPNNKMIGFAFRYGTQKKYFAMPKGIDNSYQEWHIANDVQNSITLAYDKNGAAYGTVAGGESGDAYTDRFSIYTSLWGKADGGDGDTAHRNRIEITGQKGESKHEKIQVNDGSGNPIANCFKYTNSATGNQEHANEKTKHQSPSIATAGTNVYLAYYDEYNKELRFRSSLAKGLATKADAGNLNDTGNASGHATVTAYTNSTCQIVAQENTPVIGGEYVCIAAIPKSGTMTDDVVVIVWHDASTKKTYYSYNTTPNTNRAGRINTQTRYDDAGTDKETAIVANGWSTPQDVFASAASGKFCKIAVDGNKGVHIAAYDDTNQNVVYAYLPTYDGAAQTYVVDGSGAAGENLTLDVALSADEPVPFIGYYSAGGHLPKFARLAKGGEYGNGYEDSSFTGKWEIGFVPTESDVEQGTINVGVWKTDDGDLTESKKDDTKVKADTTGVCYGNGTGNAVLGYRHTDRVTTKRGYIETAQLTGDPTAAY